MANRIVGVALIALMMACDGNDGGPDLGDMEAVDLPPPDLPDEVPDEDMPDLRMPTCVERGFGRACTTAMGCRDGLQCQPPLELRDIGGPGDPIDGLPDGSISIPGPVLFDDGFCTLDSPFDDFADCREVEGLCGECMTCVEALGAGGCYLDCDPTAPGNDVCPHAWDCVPLNAGGGICFDGCARDEDCFGDAVVREETNGIPGLQTGDDCAEAPSPCGFAGPDRLVFLPGANPTCDTSTFECMVEGTPTGEPGAMCRGDFDCVPGGDCQAEVRLTSADGEEVIVFEGGYCLGPVCDGEDECSEESVCGGERAFFTGVNRCLEGCDLTAGVDPADPATWPAGRGGCREGYQCLSNGSAANPERGVCVPDRIDPLSDNGTLKHAFGSGPSEPNVGAACRSPEECFHPFGYGTCLTGLNGRDGLCTVQEAGILEAAGFDVCPESAVVVGTSGPPTNEQECLPSCATGDDCPTGFGCVVAGVERVCFPTGCMSDEMCRTGERCIAGGCFDPCEDGACGPGLGCLPLNDLFAVAETDAVCFDACQTDAQCSGGQVCAGETALAAGACITACADATECAPGEACVDFDGATGGERECRDACTADEECRPDETCDDGACTAG